MSINKIDQLLQKLGSITVSELMRAAILAYYTNEEPFGQKGDFITSPEISQIFGELIGIWCASIWQNLGSPKINLVEIGPGTGTLMSDLLRGTKNVAGFHDSVEIYMVEISDRLKDIQKQTLKNYSDKINWIDDINQLPKACTIIVANEFLDTLPINQYVKKDSVWYERMVRKSNEDLEFCLGKQVKFSDNIENMHKASPDGALLELCQSAISVIKYISAKIKNEGGAALFIDYGYDYYGYKDTLQAIKNHKYHGVLQDVGKVDLTAHVDFIALYNAAKEQGVKVFDIITQRDFLLSMGINQRRDMLLENANKKQRSDINESVSRLIDADQMGTLFKVLTFTS